MKSALPKILVLLFSLSLAAAYVWRSSARNQRAPQSSPAIDATADASQQAPESVTVAPRDEEEAVLLNSTKSGALIRGAEIQEAVQHGQVEFKIEEFQKTEPPKEN